MQILTAGSDHVPAIMQIGYTTVFFWEYFGPLVVYALFYFFPGVLYPTYKCVHDCLGHACLVSKPVRFYLLIAPCASLVYEGDTAPEHHCDIPHVALIRSIPEKHPVQTMAVAYWTFHYAKRIFETFFVHRHAPAVSYPAACMHVLPICLCSACLP